jgi:hypothetical protein
MFWFMLQVDTIQSYLNLKIGLPPVLKAGSSGKIFRQSRKKFNLFQKGKETHFFMIIEKLKN